MIQIIEMNNLIPMSIKYKEEEETRIINVLIEFTKDRILLLDGSELTGPVADAIKDIISEKKKVLNSKMEPPKEMGEINSKMKIIKANNVRTITP
jgi:hypothetical protein